MIESTWNFCLPYTDDNNKDFEVVGLQTDNTLILVNDTFAAAEEKELKEVKLLAKNREKQTLNTPIKLNQSYIGLVDDNILFLSQKK